MKIKNLDYIRANMDPRLYEALDSVQAQTTNIEEQTNSNASGQPAPPDGPQGIQVTGQNGQFHVAIQDQSAGLRRGTIYTVEHADNPAFTNAQPIEIGAPRNHTFFLGNSTRYFRAFSNVPGSGPSKAVYFGGQASPTAVSSGGGINGPLLLPSQGSGTSAPGQTGFGQGPVPVRDENQSFDWRKQKPGYGTPSGLVASIGTPGGSGGAGGGGGSGGGSTSPPILNLVFDGDSLTKGEFSSVANPYPSKVGERLGYSQTYIHNLGENGATTATLLASHVSLADGLYDPSLGTNWYILWIGVNDYLVSTPIATTKANIQTIIAGRVSRGFSTLVLFNTPQDYAASPPGFEAWRDDMRAWYLAGSSGSVGFLNTGDLNVLSNPNWTQYYDPDHLHITDLGYIVIASGVASYLLSSLGGFNDLLSPQVYAGATPINTNFTTYDVSIEQYGALAGPNGVPSWNTKAIQFAAAAANAAGVGLYAPGEYYLVDKTNLPYGLKFYSTCTNPGANAFAAPGTRFVCSGSGLSWLKGVMNAAVPNGGNTAPSTTATTFGLQWEGILADVAVSVTGLVGIWLVRQFQFSTDNTGVYGNSSAAWAETILLDTGVVGQIRTPPVAYSTTGIALNDGTSTGLTADVDIFDPIIAHCTTGISTAFAQFCNVYRGSIQSCTTGYLGGGPNNSLYDVLFGTGGATNTKDYSETAAATAPFGGTFTNDHKILGNCNFNTAVEFKHATGTTMVGTTWGGSSSLSIDSNCVTTNLLQHNSFPATSFTDNGTNTYLASFISTTANPNGVLPGITGQWVWDATHSKLYVCTTSGGIGVAVYTQVGGSPTTLSPTYRATTGTPVSILTTDFMVSTNVSSGTGIANLPQASTCPDLLIGITNYNSGAGLENVTPHAGDTIQKIITTFLPLSQYATVFLQSDGGTNWVIVSLSISLVAGTGINITPTGTSFQVDNAGVLSVNVGNGLQLATGTTGNVFVEYDQTAWTTFTPTLTLTGGVTGITGITVNSAAYQEAGKTLFWRAKATFTSTGTGSVVSINVSLPFTAKTVDQTFPAAVFDNTSTVAVPVVLAVLGSVGLASVGVASLTTHNYTVWAGGSYEIV